MMMMSSRARMSSVTITLLNAFIEALRRY